MNIYQTVKFCVGLCIVGLVLGCSSTENQSKGYQSQWDFDHKLQFRKTKIDDHNYHLEIIPNDKIKFNRLATFLIRYSYKICGNYGYQVEILSGVEGFIDKKASPNYIQGSLIANVECSAAKG